MNNPLNHPLNHPSEGFALKTHDEDGLAPALVGVNASGRLDGVLFELTLRQSYRNTSDRTLEVIYTFPLPVHAVLLGFASELNGQRQVGQVTAKREAEARYEEALADGDAPVMLEALPNGLHTANLGNLKPGDELVLEVRFAQLLNFEQGRLRLAIPTTIAPGYGNPILAGLQPQQVPEASLLVAYPLDLSVMVTGDLAQAHIDCPTHPFRQTATGGGKRLDLAPGAWLDRDVVIVVTPPTQASSFVIQAEDTATSTVATVPSAPIVLMAALQPPSMTPRARIHLKLLVDCSGSMAGDSIASARVALRGVIAGLTEVDVVSLTRFGSTVEKVVKPALCKPKVLTSLDTAIGETDANLGGTEMEAALDAVFKLRGPRDTDTADVLLVTDGEVWQVDAIIAAAKASGHRVFVIGVGASPAEGVLRSLAEATGGACEFATPGEALEAAARRMLVRMRQVAQMAPRIDWGTQPTWQTALPKGVFGGDTVIAFAGISQAPEQPIRLITQGIDGREQDAAQGCVGTRIPGNTLARIAAARRLLNLEGGAATELAVAHQLMSAGTNFILVHERTDGDKATEEAELQRVSGMLAAGWGATSLRTATDHMAAALDIFGLPTAWRSSRDPADRIQKSVAYAPNVKMPAFLAKRPIAAGSLHTAASTPAARTADQQALHTILEAVVRHLAAAPDLQGLASHCEALQAAEPLPEAIQRLVDEGFTPDEAWLVLARWIADQAVGTVHRQDLDRAVASLDAQQVGSALANLHAMFDRVAQRGSRPSRLKRLLRALGAE